MPQNRIFILNPFPLVNFSIRQYLKNESQHAVVGEATSPSAALAWFQTRDCDLLLTALSFEEGNGLWLIKDIRSRHPHTRVLVVCSQDESLFGVRALKAGAAGYLMLGEDPKLLLEAINRVLSGKRFLSQRMSDLLQKTISVSRRPYVRANMSKTGLTGADMGAFLA